MSNSLTSSGHNNQIACTVSRKHSRTTGLSSLSLDLLIRYIDNVLSAIINQGMGCKIIDSGRQLRDLVQPVASDFSKLFDGISEGAKMFSDQKFLKSQLSTEVHSVAVDVLKGLGNVHWVAVGLLAIANVLQRFDNISANDRECIDLLKAMLKLGKYLKQMKDIYADLHKEILEEMSEAAKLIVSGAILCCSFITSNKLSKFLLTKKIRDELVYVRGKVDSMKADLMLQMQVLTVTTLTLYHRQNNVSGGNEENNCLGVAEQDTSEQSINQESEIEESCETELEESGSDTIHSWRHDNYYGVNGHEKHQMPLRRPLGLGRFLKKKIPAIFGLIKPSTYIKLKMLVEEIKAFPTPIEFKYSELKRVTNGFVKIIGQGGFGSVFHGILPDGRSVAVKMLSDTNSVHGKTEWMNELRALTKRHHRNIVELVGYCFEDNLMLVYDYKPRNLSNIIFDEIDMIIDCAKICDFGLARILQMDFAQYANKTISTYCELLEKDVTETSDHVTTELGGTLGYLDPEYFRTHRATVKSDIYSFGVTLLNIVSGKRVTEYIDDNMLTQHAWRLCEEDRLHQLIDHRLLNSDGLVNSSSITRTILTALLCIHEESKRRPSASRVLAMLLSEEEIPIPTRPLESIYSPGESFRTDMVSEESSEY
ncbi:hypothetical protein SUGI_0702750 [Cryptomeria japonica]|nr:hypothetical protein SUGI_0702750 [Cryptomeria japonica]